MPRKVITVAPTTKKAKAVAPAAPVKKLKSAAPAAPVPAAPVERAVPKLTARTLPIDLKSGVKLVKNPKGGKAVTLLGIPFATIDEDGNATLVAAFVKGNAKPMKVPPTTVEEWAWYVVQSFSQPGSAVDSYAGKLAGDPKFTGK